MKFAVSFLVLLAVGMVVGQSTHASDEDFEFLENRPKDQHTVYSHDKIINGKAPRESCYKALDGTSRKTLYNKGNIAQFRRCQTKYLSIPKGWMVAPDNKESRAQIFAHGWGTHVVVVQAPDCKGHAYGTTQYHHKKKWWTNSLRYSGSKVKPISCSYRILLIKKSCVKSSAWKSTKKCPKNQGAGGFSSARKNAKKACGKYYKQAMAENNNSNKKAAAACKAATAARRSKRPARCSSRGDPHITAFKGRYDDYHKGWRTIYQHGKVKVTAKQTRTARWGYKRVNSEVKISTPSGTQSIKFGKGYCKAKFGGKKFPFRRWVKVGLLTDVYVAYRCRRGRRGFQLFDVSVKHYGSTKGVSGYCSKDVKAHRRTLRRTKSTCGRYYSAARKSCDASKHQLSCQEDYCQRRLLSDARKAIRKASRGNKTAQKKAFNKCRHHNRKGKHQSLKTCGLKYLKNYFKHKANARKHRSNASKKSKEASKHFGRELDHRIYARKHSNKAKAARRSHKKSKAAAAAAHKEALGHAGASKKNSAKAADLKRRYLAAKRRQRAAQGEARKASLKAKIHGIISRGHGKQARKHESDRKRAAARARRAAGNARKESAAIKELQKRKRYHTKRRNYHNKKAAKHAKIAAQNKAKAKKYRAKAKKHAANAKSLFKSYKKAAGKAKAHRLKADGCKKKWKKNRKIASDQFKKYQRYTALAKKAKSAYKKHTGIAKKAHKCYTNNKAKSKKWRNTARKLMGKYRAQKAAQHADNVRAVAHGAKSFLHGIKSRRHRNSRKAHQNKVRKLAKAIRGRKAKRRRHRANARKHRNSARKSKDERNRRRGLSRKYAGSSKAAKAAAKAHNAAARKHGKAAADLLKAHRAAKKAAAAYAKKAAAARAKRNAHNSKARKAFNRAISNEGAAKAHQNAANKAKAAKEAAKKAAKEQKAKAAQQERLANLNGF